MLQRVGITALEMAWYGMHRLIFSFIYIWKSCIGFVSREKSVNDSINQTAAAYSGRVSIIYLATVASETGFVTRVHILQPEGPRLEGSIYLLLAYLSPIKCQARLTLIYSKLYHLIHCE
jgi:hypothetical protein